VSLFKNLARVNDQCHRHIKFTRYFSILMEKFQCAAAYMIAWGRPIAPQTLQTQPRQRWVAGLLGKEQREEQHRHMIASGSTISPVPMRSANVSQGIRAR
jgi:hypothetical protein